MPATNASAVGCRAVKETTGAAIMRGSPVRAQQISRAYAGPVKIQFAQRCPRHRYCHPCRLSMRLSLGSRPRNFEPFLWPPRLASAGPLTSPSASSTCCATRMSSSRHEMALVWWAIVAQAPGLFYVGPFWYGFAQAIPTVAITVLLADLTYRHVELPWNAVGERLSRGMTSKSRVVSGQPEPAMRISPT